MLFGHEYQVYAKVTLVNGKVGDAKAIVTARFVTQEELITEATEYLKAEVELKHGPVKKIEITKIL